MKIIAHGQTPINRKTHIFHCDACGCIFESTDNEFRFIELKAEKITILTNQYQIIRAFEFQEKCPECYWVQCDKEQVAGPIVQDMSSPKGRVVWVPNKPSKPKKFVDNRDEIVARINKEVSNNA